MDAYRTVLFFHLLSLFLGFGAAAILGLSLFRLRAASTGSDALPWSALAGKTERVFPVSIVGLFITGAYMTSDSWTWSTGWIDVAIVALIVIAAQGVLIAGRRAKSLEQMLGANGSGPLSSDARKMTCDRALWIVSFANPGIVLGVVWTMTQKPGMAGAIVAVVIGYSLGTLTALQFARPAPEEAGAVAAAR